MNNITTTDPEQFLANTQSDFFQIVLVTADGYNIYAGGGFYSMEHNGPQSGLIYNKRDLVKAYWEAVRFAKSDLRTDPLGRVPVEGVLHILPLPKFGN